MGITLMTFKFENFILGKDMKEVKYASNRILGLHKKLKISIHMTITLKNPKKVESDRSKLFWRSLFIFWEWQTGQIVSWIN